MSERVDGVAIVVPADGAELVRLNATGTVLWDALGVTPRTPPELAALLRERWSSLTEAGSTADVQLFLGELRDRRVVEQATEGD